MKTILLCQNNKCAHCKGQGAVVQNEQSQGKLIIQQCIIDKPNKTGYAIVMWNCLFHGGEQLWEKMGRFDTEGIQLFLE